MSESLLRFGTVVADLERRKVLREGETIVLTEKECALLRYLAARDEPVDQDELLREVWQYNPSVQSRTVRVTVGRLRKKIEEDPSDPRHLVTVYGSGYQLKLRRNRRAPSTVPAEVDRFVGRTSALDAVERQIAEGRRLLTITGAGGMGKTRLAQRFALTRSHQPTWFCELASARATTDVIAGVAKALHLELAGKIPAAEQVGRALGGRGQALLVLDNLEQVIEAAADTISGWLRAAPRLTVLATSREPLRLRGEAVFQLPPLTLDDACELFRDRATARVPDLPEEDIADIVEQVDRIPLAIELAASQLGPISLHELRAVLAEHMTTLATDVRDVDPRHATLRAAIAWSWDRLDPAERDVLARCSVFRGGWTAAAAAAVARASPELLESLVAQSLIRARSERYDLYETIRAYASEQLADPHNVRDAHAAWFARSGTEAHLARMVVAGPDELHALRLEQDNLVVALGHALANEDPVTAARTCLALARAHGGVAPATETVTWLERVLELDHGHVERLRLLVALGHAHRMSWQNEAAEAVLDAAASIANDEDVRWRGRITHARGLLHAEGRGDRAAAIACLTEAHELLAAAGDTALSGRALGPLGVISPAGENAERLLRTSLDIARSTGDRFGEGSALANLSGVLRQSGNLQEARTCSEQAVVISRELGNARKEGLSLMVLAFVCNELGDWPESLAALHQAADIFRDLGHVHYQGWLLGELAQTHVFAGQHDEAFEVFQRAIALLREAGARSTEGLMLGNLGQLCFELGRLDEARDALGAALLIKREKGEARSIGAFQAVLARVQAAQGEHEEARRSVEGAEALLREAGDPVELGKVLCHAGQIAVLAGRTDDARGALSEAAALAAQAGVSETSELARAVDALRVSVD